MHPFYTTSSLTINPEMGGCTDLIRHKTINGNGLEDVNADAAALFALFLPSANPN